MTVRHPTFRLLVGLVALAALTGCSSGSGGRARVPTTTAPRRRTPQIQGEEDELRPLLLTLRDVRSIRELPPDLEAVPETSPRSDSRDTRGPCGAKVARPSLSNGALALFGSEELRVTNAVVRPGQRVVERFLRDMRADVRTPCGPFDLTLDNGQTEHVQPLVIDVPGHTRDAVAYVVETAVNGKVDFGAAVALGHDDLLDVVGVRSSSPVPVDALLELAARASDALRRPLGPV
jgi:hypothetical protein